MGRGKYAPLRDGVCLAVLYLPVLALADPFDAFCPLSGSSSLLLLSALSAAACFCLLLSGSMKACLRKWLLSLPCTVLLDLLLAATNFPVRLTNLLYPGYGRLSAGGGFAMMVSFLVLTAAQGLALLQGRIIPLICLVILLLMGYLELTMPTWAQICQQVYY
ncbi:hypothetical protein [Dysosmobacter sp.]|uniref:hypothetical protein n=1 Tax=Dysosmobacter sp. TaxID=2591382 RepID=UPI002A891984|nr:hypothetical protein [Dysosmobacter sp.]MDY3281799.1 hypothetical protein [Dysosmobacter sp.]